MPPQPVHITFDFAQLPLTVEATVFQKTRSAALALNALELALAQPERDLTTELPDTFVQFGKDARAPSSWREDVREWILAAAFRDLVECIATFLGEVRHVCALVRLGSGYVPNDAWASATEGDAKKFHKLGLPDKFTSLHTTFASLTSDATIADILSINGARNCLVHRGGVVGAEDCKAPDGMRVTWKRLTFAVTAGDSSIPVSSGPVLWPADAQLQGSIERQTRMFAQGERIRFSPRELGEIGLTLVLFARETAQNVERWARPQLDSTTPASPILGPPEE